MQPLRQADAIDQFVPMIKDGGLVERDPPADEPQVSVLAELVIAAGRRRRTDFSIKRTGKVAERMLYKARCLSRMGLRYRGTGETLVDIERSYNISPTTIARLTT